MKNNVKIYIDDKEIICEEGQSILRVATDNGIDIPHFCYHEDLEIDANCRVCLVKDELTGQINTSCTMKAKDGLKVSTNSPEIQILRKKNMELLFAGYKKKSPTIQKGYFSKTEKILDDNKVDTDKYEKKEINDPIHKMATAAELDPSLCIACNKCVKVCKKIGVGFLKLEGKGAGTHVTFCKDPKIDCVYCGQCTVHCPVEAAREQSHIEAVEKALNNPDKIVIAQMAPSVRVSIGEEFNQEIGLDLTKKMNTALKKLGFDYVFDVNMGADITTIVEAKELADRIQNKGVLPMFTSCCPGWVKFIEFYHPELIPNLTTARSPQIHSGGIFKTWWAEKNNIDPKKIVVVSLMPCTSKKYESNHEKLLIDGMKPVDHVLTVREAAKMLKKHNVDLPMLEETEVDPVGQYSGAAAIYGATGGVMESALRSAYYYVTGKELDKVEFESVRGMNGIKKATIKIGDLDLKVGVITTVKNAEIVIEELKRNPDAYHYIEVMACPGGCIGGGGQPIPSTNRIIAKRIKGLYNIDDTMQLRKAHLNPIVKEVFETYLNKLSHERQEQILHTHYSQKRKFE
ncbi:MAG: [FeFe] hydrogenase, group A [bacterium]